MGALSMALGTNQMADFLKQIDERLARQQSAIAETLERVESMANVDAEAVARNAAIDELQRQGKAVAALSAQMTEATKTAARLDKAMSVSVWTFRLFIGAMVVAAAAMVWTGYNVHELADAEARRADAVEQVIWNQTHPDAQRGLWDVGQYHNDRDYEAAWRAKAAQAVK